MITDAYLLCDLIVQVGVLAEQFVMRRSGARRHSIRGPIALKHRHARHTTAYFLHNGKYFFEAQLRILRFLFSFY